MPEIPDSPAIAPKISPGLTLSFLPILINSLTIPLSVLPVNSLSGMELSSLLLSVEERESFKKAAATSREVKSSSFTFCSISSVILVKSSFSIISDSSSKRLSTLVFVTSSREGTGLSLILVWQ